MAEGTRRVSVHGVQQATQDLREVGESGQRSLVRIMDGTDRLRHPHRHLGRDDECAR